MSQKPVVYDDGLAKHVAVDKVPGDSINVGDLLSKDKGNLLQERSDGLYYGSVAPANVTSLFVDSKDGVDQNPNDVPGAGSPKTPLKTIAYAVGLSPSNTLRYIYLKEGSTYPGAFSVDGGKVLITFYGEKLVSLLDRVFQFNYGSAIQELLGREDSDPDRIELIRLLPSVEIGSQKLHYSVAFGRFYRESSDMIISGDEANPASISFSFLRIHIMNDLNRFLPSAEDIKLFNDAGGKGVAYEVNASTSTAFKGFNEVAMKGVYLTSDKFRKIEGELAKYVEDHFYGTLVVTLSVANSSNAVLNMQYSYIDKDFSCYLLANFDWLNSPYTTRNSVHIVPDGGRMFEYNHDLIKREDIDLMISPTSSIKASELKEIEPAAFVEQLSK